MTEALSNFHFLRPLWLCALIPAALLYWKAWRQLQSGRGWQSAIASELLPHMLTSGHKQRRPGPILALGLAWILGCLAMAGPSWEKIPQPVQRKEDALVLVLDLSQSMMAEDISPSRIVRSRQKLLDLLGTRTEGTTALVAYAGDAHVVSPLTDDIRTIANLLPALEPQIMPVPGSEPGIAVELALDLLRDAGLDQGHILLITDGVRKADLDRINWQLQGSSFRLSVLGVGTTDGSPIPTANGFLKNRQGDIVIPALKRQPLQQLASDNGGYYSDLSLNDSDLLRLVKDGALNTLENSSDGARTIDRWQDMGFWLLLLILPFSLGSFRRGWLLSLVLLLPMPEQAQALEWSDLWLNPDQRASQMLEQGDAAAAAQKFKDARWAAAASYRAGDYKSAARGYEYGEDAQAWYNRGNSLAKSGDLPAAIAAYEEALSRQPEMEDAAFNKQLLEQLQQEQEQQEQENQDQQDQDSQDQQSQDQQSQDQQQQDQKEQDQKEQDQKGQDQQNQDQKSQEQKDKEQREREQQQKEEDEQSAQEQAAKDSKSQQETERELANEQWLRRIPDDPAGLLRRKFKYESQQRSEERRKNNEDSW
jgi:Ca-activated chloride channel family protein